MARFPRSARGRLVPIVLAALGLAAATPRGALAGDEPAPAETVRLEEVEVRVPPAPVQAAAAAAPGSAVTVVDAARFAGEARDVAELLAVSPGVAVTDRGPGQLATVSIRGSSAEQVKILVDGLPLNGPAGGGVDLSSIPPQWISRVEVVRGTEGVRHGTGALGGVVNVVTAPVRAGTWSAGAAAGSFGSWQADAQAGAGGDGWGVLAAAAGSATQGDFTYLLDPHTAGVAPYPATRSNDASSLAGGLVKAYALAGGGRLDAAAQLSGSDRELPGTLQYPTPEDWQREARGLASARFSRPIAGGPVLAAGAWARLDRLSARLADLGGAVVRQRGLAGSTSLSSDWRGASGALSLQLEAGGEQLVADGYGDHTRATLAAVATAELTLLGGRARLAPGIRLERQGGDAGASAKLGGTLALAGPVSLRASAGRTYRVPSFAELYLQQGVVAPNPALRPEVGLGGDAALVLEGPAGAASAGAFATLYQDLVVYELASFRRLAPRNDARALARGLEAEAASAPLRALAGLVLSGAYTFLQTENLRGTEAVLGKELPLHPRHRLYARAAVGGPAVEAHGDVQWISRQWLDGANLTAIPAAVSLGAGASVRLRARPALRLGLEVRNLLDDLSLQDGFGNPLPGRAVMVTLRAGSPEQGDSP